MQGTITLKIGLSHITRPICTGLTSGTPCVYLTSAEARLLGYPLYRTSRQRYDYVYSVNVLGTVYREYMWRKIVVGNIDVEVHLQ